MKQNHYEKLIEYILNDETDKAREVFHNIVVSRSRQIYENMMQQDDPHSQHMGELEDDVAQEQIGEEEEEMFPSDDQTGGLDAELGDAGDSMEIGGDDMGGAHVDVSAEGGEGAIEDRVMDLEDALDELKAEFDELMSDEENEPEHNDGVDDPDFGSEEGEEGSEPAGEENPFGDAEASDQEEVTEAAEEDDEEEEEEKEEVEESYNKSASELMREYVEKVSEVNRTAEGQGVANAGKVASVNTKSTLAGKNDMGGSNKNIARGGSNPAPDGTSAPSADKPKDLIGKVQNTAGGSKKLDAAKKPATGQASGVNDTSIVAK